MAHVPIPTQKDIEEALLRRKKQELLEMYALDVEMEVNRAMADDLCSPHQIHV